MTKPDPVFEVTYPTTDAGLTYLRSHVYGRLELDDALAFERAVHDHGRGKVLVVVEKSTSYAPAARKRVMDLDGAFSGMAVVVKSPVARAAINLMIRLNPNTQDPVRLFTDETEAVAWLEGLN